jgi:hypothetical protein
VIAGERVVVVVTALSSLSSLSNVCCVSLSATLVDERKGRGREGRMHNSFGAAF